MEEAYKIKQIGLKNFGQFKSFQADIDPNVTYFCGWNGSGKSTAGVDAVWAAMTGIATRGDALPGEKFRFVGDYDRTALTELTLKEINSGRAITVSRKILKNSTVLKAESDDGKKIDQADIKDMFSSLFVNLSAFAQLSPVEQAKAIGIDTSEHDEYNAELKKARAEVNRERLRLKKAVESYGNVEAVEAVDVAALNAGLKQAYETNMQRQKEANESIATERSEIDKFNAEQDKVSRVRDSISANIKTLEDQIKAIEKTLEEKKRLLESHKDELQNTPLPEPTKVYPEAPDIEYIDTQDIEAKIESATEQNAKAAVYEKYCGIKKQLETVEKDYAGFNKRIDKNLAERNKYISDAKLPFSNISIDESGGVMMNGRPFSPNYFSHGEIIKFSSMLLASNPPKLRYVFIENASLIDPGNLDQLLKFLNEHGFQVVCEIVDNKKRGDNSVLLKDMEVVESYDDEGYGSVELK
jgi:hypothetical protein